MLLRWWLGSTPDGEPITQYGIGGFDWPEDLQELVPGYGALRVTPVRVYVPRYIVDGVQRDERVDVTF